MKRAKKTTVNSKGKFNKKKRFGKSIKNRCPSGFQTTVEKKFKVTGGAYIEVPNNYRASQYDHTQMTTLRKSCLIGSTDFETEHWYKEIGIHHFCSIVTTTERRI